MVAGLLSGLVQVYRVAISPLIGPRCRFLPSCSDYALQALSTHRPVHALTLIARRLARCHPLGASGIDEVPPVLSCRCATHAQSAALFPKDPTDSRSCPPSV
ncbi:MAG: membrane protein insertion efficiency factor YidD [Betaproteobacteria bacterium]|nr:membrane protein insertion efficiency factor YidD [Betaproteobacteria bacterium]